MIKIYEGKVMILLIFTLLLFSNAMKINNSEYASSSESHIPPITCKQNKILKKHLLDRLLTILKTKYLERKPVSCQNFDEKQRILVIFLVYIKEISAK